MKLPSNPTGASTELQRTLYRRKLPHFIPSAQKEQGRFMSVCSFASYNRTIPSYTAYTAFLCDSAGAVFLCPLRLTRRLGSF